MRPCAPEIAGALIEGLTSQGADVIELGMVSTDQYYHACAVLERPGIMVTASHNPKQFIGFKLCREEARPLSRASGIAEIEELAEGGDLAPAAQFGKRDQVDVKSEFVDHIAGFVRDIQPMKIVVDYANGMGAAEGPAIVDKVPGLEVISLYGELDGTFPNHEANPLKDENVRELKEAVVREGADVGFSFDGDADRCCVFDEKGRRVPSDLVTALLAREFLEQEPGATIVYDLRSSRVVAEEIEARGGRPVRERVGHSFIKATLREHDGVFGGELAGHYYFKDCYTADSSLLAVIEMLNILRRTGTTMSELVAPLERYAKSPEINFKVEDKQGMIGTLRELLGAGTVLGVTILPVAADGGWFTPLGLMALPPSAFFLLGLLVWVVRAIRPEQAEAAGEEQRGEVPR